MRVRNIGVSRDRTVQNRRLAVAASVNRFTRAAKTSRIGARRRCVDETHPAACMIGRRRSEENGMAQASSTQVEPEAYRLVADGNIPNNPRLSLLVYRG